MATFFLQVLKVSKICGYIGLKISEPKKCLEDVVEPPSADPVQHWVSWLGKIGFGVIGELEHLSC